MDEVMDLYHKKYPHVSEKKTQNIETTQLSSELIDVLAQRDPRQLRVLQYINQALLNMIIKNQAFRDIIISKLGNPDIFHVILHERNEYLIEGILTSPEKNIFITYGLMHFD